MGADSLDASDIRRYWANVNGQIVRGWELAVQWDRRRVPTHWRTLNPDNPEDERLLADLITWQAPTQAA